MTKSPNNKSDGRATLPPEKQRLRDARENGIAWKKWGPYLSERQWGTVREDYSSNGDAWNYFPHDHARSRAYRWGEDGIGGISDDKGKLCFSLAMWNGRDGILKERIFGLTNQEGNHGEDAKEYYFYLDSTPTHSYMKYLYKYTQHLFPYDQLIQNNRSRGKDAFEYELMETGVFDDDRYYDVFIEYAKNTPDDMLIKITAHNRGPQEAVIDLLPTFCFRNTWSWDQQVPKPLIQATSRGGHSVAIAQDMIDSSETPSFPKYHIYFDRDIPLLFTENETNNAKLFGTHNAGPYVKDGINAYVVNNDRNTINPELTGTKMSAHYKLSIPAGESAEIRLRFCDIEHKNPAELFQDFEEILSVRRVEADEFYDALVPSRIKGDREKRSLIRTALSGMMWNKQFFFYDVGKWLREHHQTPFTRPGGNQVRNAAWFHMYNEDIISMPDKWEYPWYAAWDLAFHIIAINMVDPDFAKNQLDMMLKSSYLHPNGQIPAYEWNFSDVNPPVHAFATWWAYNYDRWQHDGVGDRNFLKYAYSKLLVNFTWWLNRKDPLGHNVFEGGFLGLDNIGVFDRSHALPTGGNLEQADGTAWMVFFSQQMLNITLELAQDDPLYERFALKFFEHTAWISAAMDRPGKHRDELWDEEDGFFYDVLRLPNGEATRLKVRSMVGLLPLAGVVVIEEDTWNKVNYFTQNAMQFLKRQSDIVESIHTPETPGVAGRRMLAVCNEHKLRKILARMFDENEFLSDYGIRSLSRCHADQPFVLNWNNEEFRVDYLPGESNTGMFGGNSNWRGPIWIPVNFLLIRSLLNYYCYYGDDFKIEYPTGSGQMRTLYECTEDIIDQICSIFLRDEKDRIPLYGGTEKFQNDPHWRDLYLFYEYFQGDNGAGLGASHQTGWTGLVAKLIYIREVATKEMWLAPHPMREMAHMTELVNQALRT